MINKIGPFLLFFALTGGFWFSPAEACYRPAYIVKDYRPNTPETGQLVIKFRVDSALVIESAVESPTPPQTRIIAYKLQVLEGDQQIATGSEIELIAPDRLVANCMEFYSGHQVTEDGALEGYILLSKEPSKKGVYLSRMSSRKNLRFRIQHEEKQRLMRWKKVKFK